MSDKNLMAHHLIYRTIEPQLCLNLNNGITLCKVHQDEVHGKKVQSI